MCFTIFNLIRDTFEGLILNIQLIPVMLQDNWSVLVLGDVSVGLSLTNR